MRQNTVYKNQKLNQMAMLLIKDKIPDHQQTLEIKEEEELFEFKKIRAVNLTHHLNSRRESDEEL